MEFKQYNRELSVCGGLIRSLTLKHKIFEEKIETLETEKRTLKFVADDQYEWEGRYTTQLKMKDCQIERLEKKNSLLESYTKQC